MDGLKGLATFISEKDNLIIFIFAGINICIFIASLIVRAIGNSIRYPKGDLSTGTDGSTKVSRKTGKRLRSIGRAMLVLYQIYANLTAVFPLLGIMGTVAALITVADSVDLMSNLMVALTTTLNGVIWAVVFKCLDAILSAPLDSFLGVVDFVENLLEEAGKGDIEIVDDANESGSMIIKEKAIQIANAERGEKNEEETNS
jgi:chemotaxis protein MotA